MPNWCSNEVEIYGTKEDITKFVEECFTEHKGQSVLDFNKILPEPAIGSYKLPKKDGTPNGIYGEIVERYPSLDISWFYREDGMQMAGWLPYD